MNFVHPPVLIVGAGPVGLVAALTLLQNGISVRIVDKDPHPRIGQRGTGIWPRTREVYNFLNISEVNSLAKPAPPIRLYKPGTLEPLRDSLLSPHVEPTPAIPFNGHRSMGQQLLDVILRRHLEKFSCSVEMGTELRSFEQSDEGVTTILAKNGMPESETFNTKWIIGADGAKGDSEMQLNSSTCTRLKVALQASDDTRIVTGDICLTVVDLDRLHWHQFGNFSERGLSLRPTDEIGEDGWQFFLFGRELDLTKIAESEELIFETIASLMPTEITFNKVVWTSYFRVNIRMVNKFSEGRVFVAGDAAHVHSPTGGQGLNSGVQDAFNLGWKLALVQKGLADKSLLETYSAERLPVISEMLEMTTSILNKTITSRDAPVERSPILFMLGINCRFSTIVLDEFVTLVEGKRINAYGALDEGNLEAGDRAPDAPDLLQVGCVEPDATTLFGLYRPWYHTMLVFVPSLTDAIPILGALAAYDKSVLRSAVVLPSLASVTSVASPADLILVDQEGHAYSAYLVEAGQTKVFVIRPDGVIGAIVHGTEGVKKYFSKIFLDAWRSEYSFFTYDFLILVYIPHATVLIEVSAWNREGCCTVKNSSKVVILA
ncbi:FAD binding domain-containing protein [Suillus bovinus]|uniref:FAD binding domain-containing protein n=1 Tax=Suillus bovinus TaxID=48563 RepID=UPI001B8746F8|nr:FAD binding domain-containing protein [Suillus bovinus]KAG2157977.1 FAD binding domain-containing protein [Suillus bovinus]